MSIIEQQKKTKQTRIDCKLLFLIFFQIFITHDFDELKRHSQEIGKHTFASISDVWISMISKSAVTQIPRSIDRIHTLAMFATACIRRSLICHVASNVPNCPVQHHRLLSIVCLIELHSSYVLSFEHKCVCFHQRCVATQVRLQIRRIIVHSVERDVVTI